MKEGGDSASPALAAATSFFSFFPFLVKQGRFVFVFSLFSLVFFLLQTATAK